MFSDSSPKTTGKKRRKTWDIFFLSCSTVAVFGQSAAADVLPACKMRSEFGFHDAADGFISESGCALNGTEAMEIYDHEDWQDRQYPKRYTATTNIWMYHSYPSFGGKKQLKSCGVTHLSTPIWREKRGVKQADWGGGTAKIERGLFDQ